MADDIRVAPSANGADPAVATDEIAGKHYQKIKPGWGPDGTWAETADVDGVRFPVGGAQIGALTETAPVSDTASAGVNGRLQRVAQNLTTSNTLKGALNEVAPANDTANAGLNGRLQRVAQRLTSLIAQLPATLGQKTMANSLAVTIASDQAAQAVSGSVTANAGTNLNTSALVLEANDATRIGGVTETAPGTDTASSGLNGRLQRVAQRITSLDGRVSTLLTEALFNETTGATTDVPAASDTAASTIQGRLQRIAQRLTTLIGQLPATLGQKTMANGLGVTIASDQSAVPISGNVGITGTPTVTANAGTNLNTSALVLEANDAARIGAAADAVAAAGATGTVSAKLRGISAATGNDTDTSASAGGVGTLSAKLRRVTQGLEDLKTQIVVAAGTSVIGRVLRAETVATATVAAGSNTSTIVDCRGYTPIGIMVPATFDGTSISFQVSVDGVGFQALRDLSNTLVTMTVVVGYAYPLWGELAGWNYFMIICGTNQTTTTTDFIVQLKS